jgi:hypothetical protein
MIVLSKADLNVPNLPPIYFIGIILEVPINSKNKYLLFFSMGGHYLKFFSVGEHWLKIPTFSKK